MSLYGLFRRQDADEIPVALATVVGGSEYLGAKMLVREDGTVEGRIDGANFVEQIIRDGIRLLAAEQSDIVTYDCGDGAMDVFFEVYPVTPLLVIVGASHAAGPLSTFAHALGFRVIITDARAAFAVPERFPHAEQVLKGWPQDLLPGLHFDRSTYVVLLSHDLRFDEPTLHHVLPTSVRYIGAIGSRRTQAQRFDRLRGEGFSEEQLSRIHGPIGLDIGARTPQETALAILAEIIAVRYGKPAGFLRDTAAGR